MRIDRKRAKGGKQKSAEAEDCQTMQKIILFITVILDNGAYTGIMYYTKIFTFLMLWDSKLTVKDLEVR